MLFLLHCFSCCSSHITLLVLLPPLLFSFCRSSYVAIPNTLLLFMLSLFTLFFLCYSSRATTPFTLLLLSRYSFCHVAPLTLSLPSCYSSRTITHIKYLLAQLLLFSRAIVVVPFALLFYFAWLIW
jgi:hypothetical protein